MDKHEEAAFLGYFVLLMLLVISGLIINIDAINIVYLVVVLCCMLKFILIVNESK